MTQDQQSSALEELDARDRAQLERVEEVVAGALEAERPPTMAQLTRLVRERLGSRWRTT